MIAVCKRSLDLLKLPKDESELEEMLYNELDELTLIGLISIRDPPRADVKEAVRVIRAAGVRIFMVTGDFMITAVAIAKQVYYSPSIKLGGHTYKPLSLHRLESSHRKGTTPSTASLLLDPTPALATNQTRNPLKKRFRYRFAKLLR